MPGAVWMAAGVAGLVWIHRAMNATSVLGMIPASKSSIPMFLPFVNENHLGAALVVFLPLLVGNVLDKGISVQRRGWGLGVLFAVGALLLGCGSTSAMMVGVFVVVLTVWHRTGRLSGFVVPGLVGGLVIGLVYPHTNPHLFVRFPMWRDTLSLIADHPLAGVGAGSYGDAIESFRTDLFFLTWRHAHNEPLQFLAEFGALGFLGLLFVISLLRLRQDPREDPVRVRLILGVLGLAIHCLVEFPTRLTSIALSGVVAWGVLLGLEQTPSSRSERSIRRVLKAAAPLLLVGSVWLVRTEQVENRVAEVRSGSRSNVLTEESALRWTAPWRGEDDLHRAWKSLQKGDTEGSLRLAALIRKDHPDDAGLLIRVALLQAECGDLAAASATVQRAEERNPWDYRPHVLSARLFLARGNTAASAAAWVEAFTRQAPGVHLVEAYAVLPLGVWWVDAFAHLPPVYSYELAKLLRNEEPQSARLAMDQAAMMDPDYYGHRGFHANLMREAGDEQSAEAHLLESIALQPEDSSLWQSLSWLRSNQERWGEARDAMLKAAGLRQDLRSQALVTIEKADGSEAVLDQYEAWKRRGPVEDPVSYYTALSRFRARDLLGCVLILEDANLETSHTHGKRAEDLMVRCSR